MNKINRFYCLKFKSIISLWILIFMPEPLWQIIPGLRIFFLKNQTLLSSFWIFLWFDLWGIKSTIHLFKYFSSSNVPLKKDYETHYWGKGVQFLKQHLISTYLTICHVLFTPTGWFCWRLSPWYLWTNVKNLAQLFQTRGQHT